MTAHTEHSKEHHPEFPSRAYLSGAIGVLSGHWLGTHSYEQLFGEAPIVWITLGSVSVSLLGGWLFWKFHHRFPIRRTRSQSLSYFGLALLLLFSSTWSALSSEHLILHGWLELSSRPLTFYLGTGILLIVSWVLLSVFRQTAEGVIVFKDPAQTTKGSEPTDSKSVPDDKRSVVANPELSRKCRALILFVSPPNTVPEVVGFKIDPPVQSKLEGVEPSLEEEDEKAVEISPRASAPRVLIRIMEANCGLVGDPMSLETDIDRITDCHKGNGYWNWQPLLRSIRAMPNLEQVYLIGSPNEPNYKPLQLDADGVPPELKPGFRQRTGSGKGSFDYLRLAEALLSLYLPRKGDSTPFVYRLPIPVDFEDINKVDQALAQILGLLKGNIIPSETLIDITGGQKIASIAGAVKTLNNELRFQYVQTNSPFRTIPFDLVLSHAPTIAPEGP